MNWLGKVLLKVLLVVVGKGWLWGRTPKLFIPDEQGILPSSYGRTSGWVIGEREEVNDVVWITIWTQHGNWHRTQVEKTESGREYALVKFAPDVVLNVYLP